MASIKKNSNKINNRPLFHWWFSLISDNCLKSAKYFELDCRLMVYCVHIRVWISVRDSRPKFRNPVEKNRVGGRPPPWNSRFPDFFCFYEMKLPVSEKFIDFCVMLENFLVFVVISYCQSEVIVIFNFTRNWMQFDPKIPNIVEEYHARILPVLNK